MARESIPIECRILAIVDAFDAMINDRPYRQARTHQQALDELCRCAGTQFQQELAGLLLEVLEEEAAGSGRAVSRLPCEASMRLPPR